MIFCSRGHEDNPENVRMDKRGYRVCKACKNFRERERRKVKGSKPRVYKPRPKGTHCTNGHEYTPENTSMGKNGTRYCRTCRVEGAARTQAKRMKALAEYNEARHGRPEENLYIREEFLYLVRFGEWPESAAKRLGTTLSAICQRARREKDKEVLDLVASRGATL